MREVYLRLLTGFRQWPGQVRVVSENTGVPYATALRGWNHGFDDPPAPGAKGSGYHLPGAKAIKDVIEDEQRLAASRLAAEHDANNLHAAKDEALVAIKRAQDEAEATLDAERVRRDALARREDWGRAAANIRRNGQAILRLQAHALSSLLKRAEQWSADLDTAPMTGKDAVRLIREVGLSVRIVTEALQGAQHIEHLAVGKPTDILGLLPTSGDNITDDEAERIVERAYTSIARSKGHDAFVAQLRAQVGASAPALPPPAQVIDAQPDSSDSAPTP